MTPIDGEVIYNFFPIFYSLKQLELRGILGLVTLDRVTSRTGRTLSIYM